MKKLEDSLRDLQDNIKCINIQITGVPEEEGKKKGTEKIFEEIILENFPNMGKEVVNQAQEAQRVPYRINPRINMQRHILIKLSKIKGFFANRLALQEMLKEILWREGK